MPTPSPSPAALLAQHDELIVWTEAPLNAETPPRALGRHAITPTEHFFVRNHGPVPGLGGGEHRIVVDGLVERPLDLRLSELLARLPSRTVTATLQCAGNRRQELMEVRPIDGEIPWGPGVIGTATWTGPALGDVLRLAGVLAGATDVELIGADDDPEGRPFGGSIPLAKAWGDEVVLAHTMNGEPLGPEHGAPLRAVVPGYIGARSVKWLTRITVLDRPSANHYQAVAYRLYPASSCPGAADPASAPELGPMPVNAAILTPCDGDTVAAGPQTICGYAITGGGARVERVEVTADGGRTWQVAELLDDHGPWAWRRWRAELDLPPGDVCVAARALDSCANTQPEDPAQRWNRKGYANNAWPRVRLVAT